MRFDRVYIEISNICNLQCSFCPEVDRDKKIMSASDLDLILPQVKPLASQVCLHLMGEPLAHPKFKQVLEVCNRHEVPVNLTTNGVFISKYAQDLLLFKSLRQINFSLQSYQDNFPDRSIEEYLTMVWDFVVELMQHRPEVYINFRLWNIDVKNNNEEIFTFLENKTGKKIKRQVEVGGIKSKKIINRFYLNFDTRFEWPDINGKDLGDCGTCYGIVRQIGILADATVVPCCLDKEGQAPLGNCLENSLDTILDTELVKQMDNGFKTGKLIHPLCQRCTYIERFKRKVLA